MGNYNKYIRTTPNETKHFPLLPNVLGVFLGNYVTMRLIQLISQTEVDYPACSIQFELIKGLPSLQYFIPPILQPNTQPSNMQTYTSDPNKWNIALRHVDREKQIQFCILTPTIPINQTLIYMNIRITNTYSMTNKHLLHFLRYKETYGTYTIHML